MRKTNEKRWIGKYVAIMALCALSACASQPKDAAERQAYAEANDPIEPFNRGVFDFNKAVDDGVIKPIATVYRDALPDALRRAVRNFLNNLRSPVVFANNVLQGDMKAAQVTLARFVTNTTIGFGGVGDPAGDRGNKFRDEDFGQTLAVWGSGEGAYLMLPVLGPSNPRDVVGLVVDGLIDPFGYVIGGVAESTAGTMRRVTDGIDTRSRNITNLEELEKSSLDFYTTVRSLYRQLRTDAINNGAAGDTIPTPGITFEDEFRDIKQSAQLTK